MDNTILWVSIGITVLILALCVVLPSVMINKSGGSIQRKQKVLGIIVSSQVTAMSEISKLTGIKEKYLITTIQYLITHANEDWEGKGMVSLLSGAEALRGARLDLNKMAIILPVEKADWVCIYCRTVNEETSFTCQACQAPKKKI